MSVLVDNQVHVRMQPCILTVHSTNNSIEFVIELLESLTGALGDAMDAAIEKPDPFVLSAIPLEGFGKPFVHSPQSRLALEHVRVVEARSGSLELELLISPVVQVIMDPIHHVADLFEVGSTIYLIGAYVARRWTSFFRREGRGVDRTIRLESGGEPIGSVSVPEKPDSDQIASIEYDHAFGAAMREMGRVAQTMAQGSPAGVVTTTLEDRNGDVIVSATIQFRSDE